jgi:ribonuclease HI
LHQTSTKQAPNKHQTSTKQAPNKHQQQQPKPKMHTLFFDGCSKGNPGRAGAGAVLYDPHGAEVFAESVFAGYSATNNEAEYTGLILGLNEALKRGITELQVCGDSQLVVRQMQGKYRVKSPNLVPLHQCATTLASKFAKIDFDHVYRDKNERADALSNEGEQCTA